MNSERIWLGPWAFLVLAVSTSVAFTCGGDDGSSKARIPDPANATFLIERAEVTLRNSQAEQTIAPGSATKIMTRLAGKDATADVNGDGKLDRVVGVIQQPGGSGTFYYLAVLLNDGSGAGKAIPAKLLGDRIVVRDIFVSNGVITVVMLTRREGEPFSAAPTVETSQRFRVQSAELVPAP